MTRFDISLGSLEGLRSSAEREATTAGYAKASGGPAQVRPFGHDSSSLPAGTGRSGQRERGARSHPAVPSFFAVLLTSAIAVGDPGDPVVPVSPPTTALRSSADLDGGYVWLGATGAATRDDGTWDSVFGLETAVLRVHEHARLGVVGLGLAGARIASAERWRVSVDAIAGTRVAHRAMGGLSIGPTVDLAH